MAAAGDLCSSRSGRGAGFTTEDTENTEGGRLGRREGWGALGDAWGRREGRASEGVELEEGGQETGGGQVTETAGAKSATRLSIPVTRSWRAIRRARRTALVMARAWLRPWQMMTVPFTPRSGAPPYSA